MCLNAASGAPFNGVFAGKPAALLGYPPTVSPTGVVNIATAASPPERMMIFFADDERQPSIAVMQYISI